MMNDATLQLSLFPSLATRQNGIPSTTTPSEVAHPG